MTNHFCVVALGMCRGGIATGDRGRTGVGKQGKPCCRAACALPAVAAAALLLLLPGP